MVIKFSKSKILAVFMAFILILNTITPMTVVFAEEAQSFNKDGIKNPELIEENVEENKKIKYKGEIKSESEDDEENLIVFDLSNKYKTKDSFIGFEHGFYLEVDSGITILNKDDKTIDLKEGYTEYLAEANKPYKIKIKKENEEVVEYTVLVKTADYIEEPELEEIEEIENQTFNFGTTKGELKEALPKELKLTLNDSTKRNVAVEWDFTNFKENEIGEFTLVGNYHLPENIKGKKLPVELKVTILEEEIDTKELDELINTAKEKQSTDYTEASYNTLTNILEQAEAVVSSKDKEIITKAITDLKAAINQLVITDENYEFNEETGTITKYKGTNKNVIIPEEINGSKVKKIGDLAFGERNLAGKKLTKVTLPNTVEEIGERAFYRAHLTEVVLSNNLTEIGIEAFKHNNIDNLVIPESVKIINKGAFESNKLTKVTLPNSLNTIETNAFKDNLLTEINLPNELMKIGTGAFASNKIKALTIPANLTEVTGFANNELKEVTIPSTVSKIGKAAFSANDLTSVEIPNSVTHIGEHAFSNNSLTKLSVGNAVEKIDKQAFYDNEIKSVDLSKTTTVIEEQAFDKNRLAIGSVKIANKKSNVSIGNNSFGSITPIFLDDVEASLKFENFNIVLKSNQNFITTGVEKENFIYFNDVLNENTQELIKNKETSFHIKVEEGTTLLINNEKQEGNNIYYDVNLNEASIFTLQKGDVKKEYAVNLDGIFINKDKLKEQITDANKVIESSLLTESSEAEIKKASEVAKEIKSKKTSTQAEVDEALTNLKTALNNKQFILEVNLAGEITKYNGNKTKLIIPSTWNETKITQINARVFAKSDLKQVTIPETIKIIEEDAFANSKLEEVHFEVNKLTRILEKYDYFNLKSSENLTIKSAAFKNNVLTEVYLPYHVNNIENEAFGGNKFKTFSVKIDNYRSRVSLGENVFGEIAPTFLRTHINEVDKTYLAELIDQHKTIEASKYVKETYDHYQKNYEKSLFILENDSTKEEVAQAVEALINSKEQLEKNQELTKADLVNLLEIVKKLDTQDFDSDIDSLWRLIGTIEENIKSDLTPEQINQLYKNLNAYYKEFSTPSELFGFEILNDYELVILEYRGESSSLIIPTEIDGRKVTQIADKAFNKKGLSTVIMPETVYQIGAQAFANNDIETIKLPDNLRQLGTEVFKNNRFTEIVIPGRLDIIPNGTFSGNKTLEKVHLEEGIKEINRIAFAQSKIHTVNFPASLEKIGELAFASNDITKVHLLENIIEIGASAFQDNKIKAGNATINNVKKNVNESKHAFANNGIERNEKIELIYNGTELTTIEIEKVDNIEVELNTSLSDVEKNLPIEIELKINQSLQANKVQSEFVEINWKSTTYDSTRLGTYEFVGKYDLPEGIDSEKPEVIAQVTVIEEKTDMSELALAIEYAEKVNNDPNATVEEVATAIKNINEKLNLFKPDNNLSELEKMIQLATNADLTDKTSDSIDNLKRVIQESKVILENEYITQREVDVAVKDLQLAIDNLVDKPVDKSSLISAIKTAEAVDTDGKTADSVKNLTDTIKQSNDLIVDENVTQSEIDQQIEKLLKAIEELVIIKDSDGGTTKPDEGDTDSDGGTKPEEDDTDSDDGTTKPDEGDTDTNAGTDSIQSLDESKTDQPSSNNIKPDSKETDKIAQEKRQDDKKEKLPSSATNIFNLFALGLILIIFGILLVRRKKVN